MGAILRFGISAAYAHGIAVHAIGNILMIVGTLGLVLSLIIWGPWSRRRRTVYRREVPPEDVPPARQYPAETYEAEYRP